MLAGIVDVFPVVGVNDVAAHGGADIDILDALVLAKLTPVDVFLVFGHVDAVKLCRVGVDGPLGGLGGRFGSGLAGGVLSGLAVGGFGIIGGALVHFLVVLLDGACLVVFLVTACLAVFLVCNGFVVRRLVVGGGFLICRFFVRVLFVAGLDTLTGGLVDVGLLLGCSKACCRQQHEHCYGQ